ncbi:hypothetical protein U9M48_029229 [Paspalum notatum var. saurae]|uniref:Uncharacterized protein n=1 Tax=Paspalum notatum var. saurae TaxID=547442 RepID=A0AAQ3TYH4_PASNO
MLRLCKCILSRLLSPLSPSSPSTSTIAPLHRLFSATTSPFAVEDYLISTCHLTPVLALKASKVLSHLKSPVGPDSVVTFFSGIGLSDADIAVAVARDLRLLSSKVERTLAVRGLGLSPS